MITNPTCKFRYVEEKDILIKTPCFITSVFRHGKPEILKLKLEQWWENLTDGSGEWRSIEIKTEENNLDSEIK
jgi:hypothetical protein